MDTRWEDEFLYEMWPDLLVGVYKDTMALSSMWTAAFVHLVLDGVSLYYPILALAKRSFFIKYY